MIVYDSKIAAVKAVMFDLMTATGGYDGTMEDLTGSVVHKLRTQIGAGEAQVSKRVGPAVRGVLKASELDLSPAEVDKILVEWRSPEHILDYGWTVAYIGRGNDSRYVIEETAAALVGPGSMTHKMDQVNDLLRTKAHIEFALDRTDGRSSEGKRYSKALAGIQVAIDALLAVQ